MPFGAAAQPQMVDHTIKRSRVFSQKSDIEDGPAASKVDGFEFGVDYGSRKSNIFGTCMNTVSTVVGAGILSLPYTVRVTGYGIGIFLFIFGGIATQVGLSLLFRVMDSLGGDQLSFGRVSKVVNKTWLPLLSSFLVFLISIAVSVLFITVSANFLVPTAKYFYYGGDASAGDTNDQPWFLTRTFWLTAPFLALSAPLSLLEKVSFLQYTSGFAFLTVLYVVAIVIFYAFRPIDEVCSAFLASKNASATGCVGEFCCIGSACCLGPTQAATSSFENIIQAFPVIITAFCCAPQTFLMYNDLKRPSARRMSVATSIAMVIIEVLYIGVALAGYFTYGSSVADDLLGSYPLNTPVTIARLGIALHTSLCFPLIFLCARDSALGLISHATLLASGRDLMGGPDSRTFKMVWWFVVFLLLGAIYLIAALDISIVFLLNLGGALSVANLSFTMPGVLYLAIMSPPTWSWERFACFCFIALGIFTCLTNIVLWGMGTSL